MKRIALISDIHGNAVALEAVLDDLAGRRADELVCLGDVAASGPQPRQALARLPELGCPVVLGNADGWLLEQLPSEPEQEEGEIDRLEEIIEWARAQLSSADREFLRSFAPVIELELEGTTLLCFHGSPRSANERILAETPQAMLEAMIAAHPASILRRRPHAPPTPPTPRRRALPQPRQHRPSTGHRRPLPLPSALRRLCARRDRRRRDERRPAPHRRRRGSS